MRKAKRRWRRVWQVTLLLVIAVLALETVSRLFWTQRGVPPRTAHRRVHRAFYPELGAVEEAELTPDNGSYDVLLLGGSVLNPCCGHIEHLLREEFIRRKGNARVFNLAVPAHTSLDSYYKYRHLTDKSFDLVIVYHGINEVRANNCPPSVFRPDYSHYAWYALVNPWERRAESRWFVFPFTARFFWTKSWERLGWGAYVPAHRPRPEAMAFGSELKTPESLRRNLRGIIELAERKHEPLILMTCAFHIPPDYTLERFEQRELDYLTHLLPVEFWGTSANVAAGITAHNQVIRDLAEQHPNVRLCDQAQRLPKGKEYFNDVCHLTTKGCELFVHNLLEAWDAAPGD